MSVLAMIVPASSTDALQPGGSTSVASGSSKTHGPGRAKPAVGSPRSTLVIPHSPANRASRWSSVRSPPAGRHRARLRPGLDGRDPDGHQFELARRIAVAVAGLVLACEVLGEPRRVRLGRPGNGQLEGLAAVAQLIDDLQLRALHSLQQRRAQRR